MLVSGKPTLKSFIKRDPEDPGNPSESTTLTVIVPRFSAVTKPVLFIEAMVGLLVLHW
jgi:hypothetical protein